MRNFILILILGLLSLQLSEAQWKRLLPEKTYGFAVNPKNPKSMLVGGLYGLIYRSFDGGTTWDTLKLRGLL